MKLESFDKLYVHELRDLYNAENQQLKALPRMAKAAHNDQLRAAFEEHTEVTRQHVDRLRQIFEDLNEKPSGMRCPAMEGIIKEGDEIMKDKGDPNVVDAALIAAAQRAEHYEIAVYGCAKTYARHLGRDQDFELLDRTCHEEGDADKKLTELAESSINPSAAGE